MRRIVELTQGTDEWLSWRRERVTASNIPILLGESDFQTPLQLWEGYINPSNTPSVPNLAMQRGTALEGVVRDEYMLHTGREFIPICVENTDYPFLGASLDGYSDDEGGIVLEIKVPSKEKHEMALRGEVPVCYRGQLQCQLIVTGASRAEYVSYDYKDKSWAKVVVHPDPVYFERISKAASEFMEMVKTKTAPSLTENDFIDADTDELKRLMTSYSEKKGLLDQVSDELDALKVLIRSAMTHTRVRFGNMKASILERKGNIDYAKIKELKSVDLEKYRKPSTKYLDIRFSKSENQAS